MHGNGKNLWGAVKVYTNIKSDGWNLLQWYRKNLYKRAECDSAGGECSQKWGEAVHTIFTCGSKTAGYTVWSVGRRQSYKAPLRTYIQLSENKLFSTQPITNIIEYQGRVHDLSSGNFMKDLFVRGT